MTTHLKTIIMKVHNDQLEKILLDAFMGGARYMENGNEDFREWYASRKSKILALGTPEPLAKNKQTESICKQGLCPTDFNGKCFYCNKQIFVKDDTNARDASSR